MLDTIVHYKYNYAIQSTMGLSNFWLHSNHLFPIVGLFIQLLQSDYILFHESWISKSIFKFIPMLQTIP